MTTLSMQNIFQNIVNDCMKQDSIINNGVGISNEVKLIIIIIIIIIIILLLIFMIIIL